MLGFDVVNRPCENLSAVFFIALMIGACGAGKESNNSIKNEENKPMMVHMIEEFNNEESEYVLCSQFIIARGERVYSEDPQYVLKKGACPAFDAPDNFKCEHKAALNEEKWEREVFISVKKWEHDRLDAKEFAANFCKNIGAGLALYVE